MGMVRMMEPIVRMYVIMKVVNLLMMVEMPILMIIIMIASLG